jgi:hypothetical protein
MEKAKHDKACLDYLKSVSHFLQEVLMVVVLNDLKYMLSFYLVSMQSAMVEDFTLSQ